MEVLKIEDINILQCNAQLSFFGSGAYSVL